jgi:hypothetical protein
VTDGTIIGSHPDVSGPRHPRLVPLIVLAVATVMSLAAVWMTWDVVDQIVKPVAACERNIPLFEGLYVSEAKRAWPPPLIHCRYVDLDPGQESFRGSTTAVTLKHLVVVAMFDALVIGVTLVGFRRWRRRLRGESRISMAAVSLHRPNCRSALLSRAQPGILRWWVMLRRSSSTCRTLTRATCSRAISELSFNARF